MYFTADLNLQEKGNYLFSVFYLGALGKGHSRAVLHLSTYTCLHSSQRAVGATTHVQQGAHRLHLSKNSPCNGTFVPDAPFLERYSGAALYPLFQEPTPPEVREQRAVGVTF